MGGVCVICGSTDRLEFDHIDPTTKTFNIGKMWSASDAVIEAELQKCQLLCYAHHRQKSGAEITAKAKHGGWTWAVKRKCPCEKCELARIEYKRKNRKRRHR